MLTSPLKKIEKENKNHQMTLYVHRCCLYHTVLFKRVSIERLKRNMNFLKFQYLPALDLHQVVQSICCISHELLEFFSDSGSKNREHLLNSLEGEG